MSNRHYDNLISSNPEPEGHAEDVRRGARRSDVTTASNVAYLDISPEAVEVKGTPKVKVTRWTFLAKVLYISHH